MLTERVEVGAFYTNGTRMGEVTMINPPGYVTMIDTRTGEEFDQRIDTFGRTWWLVRKGEPSDAG